MEPLLLALVLLLAGAALWWLARRGRARSGLPQGRVVYTDSSAWRRPPAVLRAPRYGLVGRPDYIVRQGRQVIPVEAKPGRQTSVPYEADVMQLAAYCLLVEEGLGHRPPHGLLVYHSHTFEIPFDDGLRQALLDTLQEMRDSTGEDEDIPRSHDEPARCAACSMREHCGAEALV